MPTQIEHQVFGSFAPPLDADKLAHYEALAKSAPDPRMRDAMLPLVEMVRVFQQTPASSLAGTPHPVGIGRIVPLEQAEIERIWDHVPWDYECKALKELFGTIPIPEQRPLRNAAFHLLWFAYELTRDREPFTNDKLPKKNP